ncbi:MAG: hypothetical protein ABL921_35900, partial [Pirellula sp.]
MSYPIDSGNVADDQIVELFRICLGNQGGPDPQREAMNRLTRLIFQMELHYISKVVCNRPDLGLDTEQLANDATFEFLDCYLIRKHRTVNDIAKVLPL